MNFLGRARKFFKELASEPESKVQYFNVTCAAGHRVRGERTEGYQALRCPACGDGIFVLPRSPLPEPAAPARSPATKRAGSKAAWAEEGPVELTDPGRVALEVGDDDQSPAGAEIIWDDVPAETSTDGGRGRARRRPPADTGAAIDNADEDFWEDDIKRAVAAGSENAAERPARKSADDARTAARRAQRGSRRAAREAATASKTTRGQVIETPAPEAVALEPGRRTSSRLGLILVVVPLLVIATVAWRIRQNRRQEYPVIAERGRTEGIPALEAGEFDKAYPLLWAAKSAVDALGGAVDDADKIRDAAAEAAIFVDQTRSLEDMLDEAGRTDPQVWASRFDTLYKGRAILIDSSILEEPEAGRSARYLLEYVVLPPGAADNFAEAGDRPVMA